MWRISLASSIVLSTLVGAPALAQEWVVGGCAIVGGVCDVLIDQTGALPCGLDATIQLSKQYQNPCAFHHPAHRWARLQVAGGVTHVVTVTFNLTTYDYWNGSEHDVFYVNCASQSFGGPSGLGATTCNQTHTSTSGGLTWWWGGDSLDCPANPCQMAGTFTFEYFDQNPQSTIYVQVGLSTGSVRNSHGQFTISIRQKWAEVELTYRTFIHCNAMATPPVFFLHPYYQGDNRWFHAFLVQHERIKMPF